MINLATTQQSKKEKTELILLNICNLPPIPKLLRETLDLLNNESTPITTVSKVVSKDQGLVTKILAIANSPMYGLARRVTTIEFAIIVLGFKELKNIVTVLSLVEAFINKTDKYLNQKEFWLHSYFCGTAAKKIAEDFDFQNSGEAFITGFLHDMGITVIHRYFHSNFISILDLVNNKGFNFLDAEKEILGLSHEQIGHFLMGKWNFPEPMCDAILYHHDPSASEQTKVLSSIIHLADYMTNIFTSGNSFWDSDLKLDERIIPILGLNDVSDMNDYIESKAEIFKNQMQSTTIF